MEFLLQMGHGMQTLCESLIDHWGGGRVIVSPTNMAPGSVINFSKKILKKGGGLLFDPQMYFPEKYHKKLSKYSYWNSDLQKNYQSILQELIRFNNDLKTDCFILPSYTIDSVSDEWLNFQRNIVEFSREQTELELYLTISLGKQILKDERQIERIISLISKLKTNVYLVAEHPEESYLVEEPLWILNILNLITAIKRQNLKVYVGYASHQMLFLASANCDAIASGNFLNVRRFQRDKFETTDEKTPSRRSLWYYSPNTLSEFKIPYLDMAYQVKKLPLLEPPSIMKSSHSAMLFRGELPSSTGYKEADSFFHYLNCLKYQTEMMKKSSYRETFETQMLLLNSAEIQLKNLKEAGISGQAREYDIGIIEVTKSALQGHKKTYELYLNNKW